MGVGKDKTVLSVNASAETNIGARDENEDCSLAKFGESAPCGTLGLFAVADGMGGSGNGGAASRMTMEILADVFPAACQVNEKKHAVDTRDLLRFALQKANAAIFRFFAARKDNKGAGTACVAAAIADNCLHLASVGDCRAYLMRSGQLERLTQDEWVKKGAVTVVNQAIGHQMLLTPQVNMHSLMPGDTVVLATDGLTDAVPDSRIAEILSAAKEPSAATESLIKEALLQPEPDNITVLVMQILGKTKQ